MTWMAEGQSGEVRWLCRSSKVCPGERGWADLSSWTTFFFGKWPTRLNSKLHHPSCSMQQPLPALRISQLLGWVQTFTVPCGHLSQGRGWPVVSKHWL